MKRAILFLCLLIVACSAHGQTPAASSTGAITASGSTCGTTNACISLNLANNVSTVSVTVSGTFTATLVIEKSADNGTNWTTQTTVSAAGLTTFAAASLTNARVRASAYTSGTATITIAAGTGAASAAFASGAAGPGYQDVTEIAAPANPASGTNRVYADSTLHQIVCLTSSGGSCFPTGSGTVTSVSFTGGIISVANPTTTPAFTLAGTSGGIPYFSGATTWASSAALTANLPVIGGGAGSAPAVGTRTGNTTQFATWTGATTAARCVDTDASGNLQITAADCGSGGGTVTSIATTSPITGGTITTTGTIACATCVTSAASLTNNQLVFGAGTQASAVGDLTGDVTTSGGKTTVLGNIPTAVTAAGSIVFANIAAPASPSAGKVSIFSDSTDLRFHDKNASGVIGTTVVADTGASNNFLTAISAAGAISKAQPAFSNLSGNIVASQMLALTSAHIYVGNGSNVPADVALGGDGTLSNTGALTLTKVNGVTFPSSFTSGGIPYASSSSAISSSGALTQYGVVFGGGAGGTPTVSAQGAANMPLIGQGAANPIFSTIAYPTSLTSGGVLYASSTTAIAGSGILNTGFLVKGAGAGAAPTNSLCDEGATTANTLTCTNTSGIKVVSVATGTSPPACTVGTAGAVCAGEGTVPTNVASTAAIYPDSTQHEWLSATNGSSSFGMMARVQPGNIHQTGKTAAISTATLCAASAGACNVAGMYTVEWAFTETGTACATPGPGGVTFLLTWTDTNSTAHSAISLAMDDATSIIATTGTFHFQTSLGAAWGSGQFNISTNGTIIQYATGYTACTSGTGTYQLDVTVTRKQ